MNTAKLSTEYEHEKYTTDTMFVSTNGRTVQINYHTPILPQKERERRKREAEQQLFDVFSKYRKTTK